MKKFIITIIIYSAFATRVFANSFPNLIPISFEGVIENLLSLVPAVVTLTFVGLFFWGGYTWMTAADNEDKVTKARAILMSALFGLLFIFAARPLLGFLETLFGAQESPLGTIIKHITWIT